MKSKTSRKTGGKTSGLEEEPVQDVSATEPVNLDKYLDAANEVNSETSRKRGKYRPRAPKQPEPVLGEFFVGLANTVVGALNSVLGEDAPLSASEKKMIEFSGNQLEQYGDMGDFNEKVGKAGWYLLGGSFLVLALSRVIPAYKRKKGLLPANVVE